jgi:hypothetical protein
MRSWFANGRPTQDQEETRQTLRLGLGLLALGIVCRLHVYFLSFPIWRDEAALALNFSQRDFRGLVRMLDNFQIAPLLFLWTEKAVYQFLGGSAALLRMVPLLAGVSALILFWRLVRNCLQPLPAILAVGCLAVAASPIHLASMVKPYSVDLFVAVGLFLLAADYLQEPSRIGRLAALALVIPFAIASSYPAVFIAGSISLVLLPVVWKQEGWKARGWFVAFNLLCGATFLAHLQWVGREVHDPALADVGPYMSAFWKGAFLPRQPLPALHWLLRAHVGHMLSYPIEFNGGGFVGLLLCIAGGHALYRQRMRQLLALCLLPFALNLVAGAFQRYPYAGDQRLEQHLVPGICILLGSGLADLLRRLPVGFVARRRCVAGVVGLLVLIGVAGAVGDARRPYHDSEAVWAENIAGYLRQQVHPEDQIVLAQPEHCTLDCIRWQLLPFESQMRLPHQIDWATLERTGGRLWLVEQLPEPDPSLQEEQAHDPLAIFPQLAHHFWHILDRTHFVVQMPSPTEPAMCISLLLYARR